MSDPEAPTRRSKAERDDYAWAFAQARALRHGRHAEIDADAIAHELETVGRREVRELERRLVVLLSHLMKWELLRELRGKAWAAAIDEQRRAIRRTLEASPSLRQRLDGVLRAKHGAATRRAALETGYPRDHFPWAPTYSLLQVLDDGFWPELD